MKSFQNLKNDMNLDEVIFDFSNVNFATRSFLDEFYNVFIKGHHVKLENVPNEIAIILGYCFKKCV